MKWIRNIYKMNIFFVTFDISVDCFLVMAVLERKCRLWKELTRHRFAQPSLRQDEIHDLSARGILHDEMQVGLGLDDLVEPDNVGVPQHLHDLHLPLDHLHGVGRQVHLVDLFDRHLPPGLLVCGKPHFAELPLSHSPHKKVVAYPGTPPADPGSPCHPAGDGGGFASAGGAVTRSSCRLTLFHEKKKFCLLFACLCCFLCFLCVFFLSYCRLFFVFFSSLFLFCVFVFFVEFVFSSLILWILFQLFCYLLIYENNNNN